MHSTRESLQEPRKSDTSLIIYGMQLSVEVCALQLPHWGSILPVAEQEPSARLALFGHSVGR
eukprot:8334320-Pyramimonas_sp.AAC.1